MTIRPRVRITRDEYANIPAPTPLDFRDATGMSDDKIRALIRDGTLPSIRVGRRIILNRKVSIAMIDGEPFEDVS